MPHADIDGQRIFFDDTGGDGPAVILAHGFLMDHEMFEHQVAALRDDYRVITWDERGFGQTEYDGEPFTYWDSANDCLGLLDHLGIDRAVVGGGVDHLRSGGQSGLDREVVPAARRLHPATVLHPHDA